ERLLYLPSAGFCLLLAVAIVRIGRDARLTVGLTALVVSLYAARTVARNEVWRDPLTFFQAMVAYAPRSARSHRELALALSERNRVPEALAELDSALALAPGEPMTLYNLGNVLARAGRYPDAITAYEQSLERGPRGVSAYVNLGNVYSARGDEAAAEGVYRRGLAVAAGSADLHLNLAN